MKRLKKIIAIALISITVVSFAACNNKSNTTGAKTGISSEVEKDMVSKADTFINLLKEKNNEEMYKLVDDAFKSKIDFEKFKETNASLDSLGAIKSIEVSKVEKIKNDYAVEYKTTFETAGVMTLRIALTPEGKVMGYFLQPYKEVKKEEASDKYKSEEVTIGSDPWKLPGTLLLPNDSKGKLKAVVLVHGTGANNRDEDIMGNAPFRDIAKGLAEKGIAVLKYDKRNFVYGPENEGWKGNTTPETLTVDDAIEAVNYLKSRDEIDPDGIFVLGHSIGGYYMPKIYERESNLAGYISLAGTIKDTFEDLVMYQGDYLTKLDGKIDDEDKKVLDQFETDYENIKDLKNGKEVETENMFGYPHEYWLSLKGYDPLKVMQTIDKPMLILQGSNDYQVPKTYYDYYKNELSDKNNFDFKLYDGLTHLFMEGDPTPEAYNTPSHVDEKVIDDIAEWIKEN